MPLHVWPKKSVRRLRKSVTCTDIDVNLARISLHGLVKGLARRTQWRPPRANLLLKIHALTLAISDYVRDITRTMKSTARLLMKETVTMELATPSRHPARLLAHVSRRWEEDVGIEWCELSPSFIKDLLRSPTMWLSLYVVVAFRRAAERILSRS